MSASISRAGNFFLFPDRQFIDAAIISEQPKRKRTDLGEAEFEVMLTSGNIQLFDVRNTKEVIECGKIPTAVNIPCKYLID